MATIRWVVTNSPSGHSSASSSSTWPPPSLTRRVAHGSGTHAPSRAPAWNAASVSALSCGVIVHVAAAAGVGLVALLGEPRPQGDVLGVAERRRRQRRAGEVVGRVDALAHDERGAARRRAGDDAQRLAVGLGVAVDRRVGADEAGVEGAGEHRLDDLGAGVERRQLELDVGAERLGEQPGLDADDRRGVGDVREVAEAQRDGLACAAASSTPPAAVAARRRRRRRRTPRRRGRRGEHGGETNPGKSDRHSQLSTCAALPVATWNTVRELRVRRRLARSDRSRSNGRSPCSAQSLERRRRRRGQSTIATRTGLSISTRPPASIQALRGEPGSVVERRARRRRPARDHQPVGVGVARRPPRLRVPHRPHARSSAGAGSGSSGWPRRSSCAGGCRPGTCRRVDEALDRLERLRRDGVSDDAFTLRDRRPAPPVTAASRCPAERVGRRLAGHDLGDAPRRAGRLERGGIRVRAADEGDVERPRRQSAGGERRRSTVAGDQSSLADERQALQAVAGDAPRSGRVRA